MVISHMGATSTMNAPFLQDEAELSASTYSGSWARSFGWRIFATCLLAAAVGCSIVLHFKGGAVRHMRGGSISMAWELSSRTEDQATSRPIVGVLTLPCRDNGSKVNRCPEGKTAWFPASYVKWLEAAGLRVAPILHHATPEEMDVMLDQLNGVLLTGGNATYDHAYQRATKHVIQRSIDEYANGGFLPVWGTCLGFETMMTAVSKRGLDLLTHGLHAENVLLTLLMKGESLSARMFGGARGLPLQPGDKPLGGSLYRNWFAEMPLAVNEHSMGVLLSDFEDDPELSRTYKVLATSLDPKSGLEFVSAIEGRDGLPFFGVQFHPEKPAFEWWHSPIKSHSMLHSMEAMEANQYLGIFFGSVTRRSEHRFKSKAAERSALIYNWNPVFEDSYFMQSYFFAEGNNSRV
eukprot:CAMPEP_0170602992 /NCGR_PEP_ID=MMETSP0224-20130122/18683_1 /TAXON_ID=285029 /ORGANISM="Togula jolla, Strain CCCM 725" /LENGTH=405 /DNA_ID=CAMNT_0010927861 /DNA_START=47 /DNA_END=1264 /DNA_ORIENTATION=+